MSDFQSDVEKAADAYAMKRSDEDQLVYIDDSEQDFLAGAKYGRERGFSEARELLRSDAARDIHMRAKKREAFWPSDWAFWLGEKRKEMGN